MELGEAIRALRSSAGFSQDKFAQRLEISASYLSLLEKGRREATIPLLRKMAEVLGAPATVLFAAALGSAGSVGQQAAERRIVEHLIDATRLNILAARIANDDRETHTGSNRKARKASRRTSA